MQKVKDITQTVYDLSMLKSNRTKVKTIMKYEIKLVIDTFNLNTLIFKIATWVKIQANGMHKKNNISSIGSLNTYIPSKYLGLKPQYALSVKY